MNNHQHPIAIIGAGPYGLAAAAHLRSAGIETVMYGKTMHFWQHGMPRGMRLRSTWDASHIADPRRALTLNCYECASGKRLSTPIPLEDFVAYGKWFQDQTVKEIDPRCVIRVIPSEGAFQLTLEDGEQVWARRVVVAAGIAGFAYRPPQFGALPPSLASHTSAYEDLRRFAGRRVAVIGGGQSALESAALLRGAGAEAQVITRASRIRWLQRSVWLHQHIPGIFLRLLYHQTDVGPPMLNQIVARPHLFQKFPRRLQARIAYRSIRPAATGWLRSGIEGVKITTGRQVVSVNPNGRQVCITLDDGNCQVVDHILLATGYQVDISKYPFLSAETVGSLKRSNGYPVLSAGLEASLPGLHFLGAPAAWSFGPLLRFVSGTSFAARELTRVVLASE